uniref:histidine kinase n=1 Tax=Oscillatoriales cyanobacterium SpSt-402 TaxID=2282168 RepID=A0A832H6Q8_9CYAN
MPLTELSGTLLIVDDTPANLGVLSDFLGDLGFRVLVAQNGESAIQKAEYALPDLILLDVMMPGIDGFETCRRLKLSEKTREIPIIFMTALADTDNKVKGFSLGAVDYLTKPIQHEEMLVRINLHLRFRKLTKQLHEQNMQLQKVSSLGQLVAGVAHEVNNPVGFISGNLHHAEAYVNDLFDHLKLYQQQSSNASPEIQAHREEIDLDYLLEDLPKMLSSMRLGIERIRDIMASLRIFLRVDEAEKKPIDLHEGIESTLMILQHRLKAIANRPAIQIIKDYGELPLVECYGGQLNQVFMNILSNAIDALEESWVIGHGSFVDNQQPVTHEAGQPTNNKEQRLIPTITIRTAVIDHQQVQICIADNGPGISVEVQQRLFDPFFTTKPSGKGTGLGLSISHQIVVEKHGGNLYCRSERNQGAEWVIELPVK